MKRWISPLFACALMGFTAGATAQNMSPPAFTDLDLNGDGMIDADEFAKHQAARMSERHGNTSARGPGRGQGKGQGTGQGRSDGGTMQRGAGRSGQGVPAYGDIDLDDDDCISAEEFAKHVAARHGAQRTQQR